MMRGSNGEKVHEIRERGAGRPNSTLWIPEAFGPRFHMACGIFGVFAVALLIIGVLSGRARESTATTTGPGEMAHLKAGARRAIDDVTVASRPVAKQTKADRERAKNERHRFARERLNLPAVDSEGLTAITLAPGKREEWWDKGKVAVVEFVIDDEEWDSYEVPADHVESSKSCAECHSPASRKVDLADSDTGL